MDILESLTGCINNGVKIIGMSAYCNNVVCNDLKTKEFDFDYNVYQVHFNELPKKLQDRDYEHYIKMGLFHEMV